MVVTHVVATPERFATGLTYAQFLEQINLNRDRFQQNYEALQLDPEDRDFFAQLPQRYGGVIKVLSLGEDW